MKNKIDQIVEKANQINKLMADISRLTNGSHSLIISEYGKKRKRHYLTVSIDITKI